MASERVCVGQLGAPHGVRGELRLRSFTQEPADVAAFGPLSTEDGARQIVIASMRPAKDHFVVRIRGVETREAAQALTNTRLYIDRAALPAVDDDETFYCSDLVGLTAVDAAGATLGTVSAVHNFGAGDVIEITPIAGEPLLVPFTKAAVPELSLAERRIVVTPPALSE